MKKKIDQYELSDFLLDSSFIMFINGSDSRQKQKWEDWLAGNPQNKDIAEKAYRLLTLMTEQGNKKVKLSKTEEYKKLIHRIEHQRYIENEFIERSLRNWLKVAAAIIILLSAGMTYLIIPFPGKQKSAVSYNEITVPKGSKTKVELEDGSIVWINAESTLRYPSRFTGSQRKVQLSGEAYFNVTRSAKKPFIVTTADIQIKVLGTSFNVKAYPQDDFIVTTLESGIVNIENLGTPGRNRKPITLKPDQKLVLYKSSLTGEIKELDDNIQKSSVSHQLNKVRHVKGIKADLYKDIDTKTYTSWKDGKLVFKNEPLSELASRLEKWYNANIQIADESLKTRTYTGTFEKETLEQALTAISLTSNINFKMDKNNITIYK